MVLSDMTKETIERKKDAAERRRVEMFRYMERNGLNQTEFAWGLSPEKDKVACVGKFLRGAQDDLRGGLMQRFVELQNQEKARTPGVLLGPDDEGVTWEAEVIALALEGVIGGTLRNPDKGDSAKYLDTIAALNGLLQEMTSRVNFNREATTRSESNLV